ncbi:flavin reductase [Rhizobium sp. NLR17b]|nr:flavin reductase [Rhizobium sp. NLR17b]
MPNDLQLIKSQTLNHSYLEIKDSLQPAITPMEFKNGLAAIAYPVAVAVACDGEEQNGRTVTSVISLSVNPPRLLISIDTTSRMVDLVTTTKKFSVSMLSCGQQNIADAFSGKLDTKNPFGVGRWTKWPSGSLKLAEATLAMDCELVGSVDMADHILFVGAVVEAQIDQMKLPLLWTNRTYAGPTLIQNTYIN